MAFVLGIDTTSRAAHVALLDSDRVLAQVSSSTDFAAEALIGLIDKVCADCQTDFSALERIAVCLGPGSFTGIRSGIATAQGLAAGLGLGVVGVSALFARSLPLMKKDSISLLAPILTANAEEKFVSLYASRPFIPEDSRLSVNSDFVDGLEVARLAPPQSLSCHGIEAAISALWRSIRAEAVFAEQLSVMEPIMLDIDLPRLTGDGPAALVARAAISSEAAQTARCDPPAVLRQSQRCSDDIQTRLAGIGLGPLYIKKVPAKTLVERAQLHHFMR